MRIWLQRGPERLLRAGFGPPPRNDRGAEMDLRTHVLLQVMAKAGLGQLHRMPVARARRHYTRDGTLLDLPATRLAEQRDFELPGPAGSLRCRLYRPQRPRGNPAPMLVWFHGGGYVIGDLDSHARACAWLADRVGCVVVAVDYRKAPEHKFPAASDDGLASVLWLREHAERLGADPRRVAIGGDSAGANLSAGLCHRLREAGEAQPLVQVLVYPMTQHQAPFPSRQLFGRGALLTTEMIDWFRGHYLRDHDDARDPLISPLLADRFDALAPAIIHTAGFDPLRDEGQAYADALREAGVSVRYRCHEPLIHGFFTMGGVSPAMRHAVTVLCDDLTAAFARAL